MRTQYKWLLPACCLTALTTAGAAPPPPEPIVVTGTVLSCSEAVTKASYGPRRKFDGILFSFIDGALFTPCTSGKSCNGRTEGRSYDLKASDKVWSQIGERGFQSWGYYRLTFQGRQGRYDRSRFCISGSQDFYKVDRILRFERVPDPRYPD